MIDGKDAGLSPKKEIFKTNFGDLCRDVFLRMDPKYHIWAIESNFNVFTKGNVLHFSRTRFKQILFEDEHSFLFEEGKKYKGLPTGFRYFDEEGDIAGFLAITKTSHPDRIRYSAKLQQIVVSSLKGAKTPAIYVDERKTIYAYSNGFYIFSVKDSTVLPRFVYFLLKHAKTKAILDENIYRGIGIQAFYARDLLNLWIPFVPLDKQRKTLENIEPLVLKIQDLKKDKKNPKDIVNESLGQRFGYSLGEFDARSSVNIFGLELTDLSRSFHLKSSTKFHHPKYEYLFDVLRKHRTIQLKHLLLAPPTLGKSPQYDPEGTAYYISPDVIKSGYVNFEDASTISETFYLAFKKKLAPRKGDIIMVRSSASSSAIGKTALFEAEEDKFPSIISDFTMRIIPNPKKINPRYLYYYTKSFLFRQLVELEKKGKNILNIFPSQIETFPIICLSLVEQNEIVREIETRIEQQQNLERDIKRLRNEIDSVVEESLAK
jgi:type I restriction enzyme S subunit